MNWLRKFWKSPGQVPTPGAPSTTPAGSDRGKFQVSWRFDTREDYSVGNFTPRAQQSLALARKEAMRFNHNFVGTEHVLLGLIALGQGTAVTVLSKLGLNLESVRAEIVKHVGTGPDQILAANIPFTPRVKKVLAFAAKEAKALNHTYVGTEHILLGLLREGDGVAARVLLHFHVDIEQTRREILQELDPDYLPSVDQSKSSPSTASRSIKSNTIDTRKRYDVYCTERNQEVVVYRNALFKGIKKLFSGNQYDAVSEFVELEQANGETIFLSRFSVMKFCEHGATPGGETISGTET